ncbi:hypothetical protein GE061_011409 [Apolygus lucorum]|uniref:Uncharacterized protein n=1 Tax=Apolygus lucorum TaxID=248454 RepID=A0A8S9XXR5_APOLU|nr:hypothetical protein GE061_011409 [Apolygus lucorum]
MTISNNTQLLGFSIAFTCALMISSSFGSAFVVSFLQTFLEGALKVGDVVQELNNLAISASLTAWNNFPSSEYLWNVFLRLVIFIPFVIYLQFKIYKLERRIYELTWTLSYQLRRDMFKVSSQQSKTSMRRSNSGIVVQSEFSPHKNTMSTSSAAERPRRRSVLQMGGVSSESRIFKVKSSPVLFHKKWSKKTPINLLQLSPQEAQERCDETTAQVCEFSGSFRFQENSQNSESWKTNYEGQRMEISSLSQEHPAKRLKRDMDDSRSTEASQESSSMVMRMFQQPHDSLHQTIMVEYCNVLRKREYPSGISQDLSTCTTNTRQNFTESTDSVVTFEGRKSRDEDVERKWRRIIERNNNIRNDRLAKLKEIELQKLQERERARKAEMARRRAIIARIREQNRKHLLEQRGMQINENDGGDNEIVLPVVRVKPFGSVGCQDSLQATVPSIGDLTGQVPVLRVTQRTFTIEHTAKISKSDKAKEYNLMEPKFLHMGDVEANNGEVSQNVVKETPKPKVARNSEYYLLSRGTPPDKQLAYLKMSSNSGVATSETSVVKSEELRSMSKLGDTRQAGLSLQTISRNSNSLFQSTSSLNYEDFKHSMTFPRADSPGSMALSDPKEVETEEVVSSNKIDELSNTNAYPSSIVASCKSDHEETAAIQDIPDEKTPENVMDPCEDNVDTMLPHTPTGFDVEALPPSLRNFDFKGPRPLIKRARRKLLKGVENTISLKNQTARPKSEVSKTVPSDTLKIVDPALQEENQSKPKSQNVKAGVPKSLLLKKIELRKRLEERRKAVTCLIDDAIGRDKKDSDVLNLEELIPSKTPPSVPGSKPRRYSFDGNTGRIKEGQSRAAHTVTTMKKGNLRSPEEMPRASTPKESAGNRPIVASPNKRLPFRTGIQSNTDETQCRANTATNCASGRSPVGRRMKGNYLVKPDFKKSPDVAHPPKTLTPSREVSPCRPRDLVSEMKGRQMENKPALVAERKLPDEPQEEVKEGSPAIESNAVTNKRSDFLSFQMDESGHPVPVKHSKATRLSISRGVNHRKSEVNDEMQRNVLRRKPKKPEEILRTSTKRFLKDEYLNDLGEEEWNRRMKTWEKKREQLSCLKSSTDVYKLKQQSSGSQDTPLIGYQDERVEIKNTKQPRESAIEVVKYVVSPDKFRQNGFKHGYTQQNDIEDGCDQQSVGKENNEHIVNDNENRNDRCGNQGKIELISEELVSDFKVGSVGVTDNPIVPLRKVRKNPETSGGVFLSPIQSVSENNYHPGGVNEPNIEIPKIKKRRVSFDQNVKPEEPLLKEEDDSPINYKIKETDFVDGKVLVSLWACDRSVSDERQRRKDEIDNLSAELPLTESGNKKIVSAEKMASDSENSREIYRDYLTSEERLKVLSERKGKSTTSGCVCIKKDSDLSVILGRLFTVTKALNEQRLNRKFKKNHSKPLVGDDANDRTSLNAIVCYPLGSPVDGIESLSSSVPELSSSETTQKSVSGPVIFESVATTPAEFYERARETNDRFVKRVKDGGHHTSATRIEWYEGAYVPMSSEEMETHHDSRISVESHSETVVDKRQRYNRKDVHCRAGYGMRNFEVKRRELHHDSCPLYNKEMRY